jgi:hypothetical protein
MVEVVSKYDNPELITKIVELRTDNTDFESIANSLKEEYPSIDRQKVSELYKKGIARSVTVEGRAGKKFTDFSEQLDKMYKRAVKLMERYINALERLTDMMEQIETGDQLADISVQKQLIKTIPQATSIFKELREYMKFHHEQQEKIIEQRDEMIWDEQTLMDNMKNNLELLKKEGYRIIKPKICERRE